MNSTKPLIKGAHQGEARVFSPREGAELEACFRLRYRYFVDARAWVVANDARLGIECDHYDDHALHLSVWDDEGIAAYVRALPFKPGVGFMLDRELSCILSEEERQGLPRKGAVELSRLVVRTDALSCRPVPALHLVELLLRRLYRESKERGFERFYIVVEEGWLRPFVRRFGLPFQVIGEPHVFPDGTRTVAAVATMEELEAGMRRYSAAKHAWYQEEE